MIAYIAKDTFRYIVQFPMWRKAVAMAIFLKNKNRTSVFKDWTLRSLARETGLSPNTVKRYLRILHNLRLVRDWTYNGHTYLEFKKLRKRKIKNKRGDKFHTPKFCDISLTDIDLTDMKSIDKELAALVLKDHAVRSDKVRQLIKLGTDPAPFTPESRIKRAKSICRELGLTKFEERGLSYTKICKRLHCSPNTARTVIMIGESLGLYSVERRSLVLVEYAGYGKAKERLKELKWAHPTAFATFSNIYERPCLIFRPTERVALCI